MATDSPKLDGEYVSAEGFLSALDKIGDQNYEYWKKYKETLESYKDVHPVVVVDDQNKVEVYVKGGHKGTGGLVRVSYEAYFSSLHEREGKSQHMCRVLWGRVEELEGVLEDCKIEMERNNGVKVEQVRHFWRNKIFEEGSRSGRMLMASGNP